MANDLYIDDFVKRIAARTMATFSDAKAESRMPPHISRRSDRFWLVQDGQKTPAPDPLTLEFVVVAVKKPLARFLYDGVYEEGKPPTCWSMDSVTPEDDVPAREAICCKDCKQAEWGSARSKKTGEEIAACRVEKQMAVQVVGVPGLWLFTVPAASIKKQWGAYVEQIERAGKEEEAKYGYATLTLSTIVTRCTFDEKQQGVLNFKPRGYIGNRQVFSADECDALEKALDDHDAATRVFWGPKGVEREQQYLGAKKVSPAIAAPARVASSHEEDTGLPFQTGASVQLVAKEDPPFLGGEVRAEPAVTKPKRSVKLPVDEPKIMTEASDPASVKSLLEGLGIGDL
ncbi:MAG: hypothetical protein PHS14_20260 [Elusimicrobia bacterium]|nr:hypothetical protein [Elusimicrobiota bacterium]